MISYPIIERSEVDRLATEWCKAKHVVVMLDDVSKKFATDVVNQVLKNFIDSCAEKAAAKKTNKAVPGTDIARPNTSTPPVKKSAIVLTDS